MAADWQKVPLKSQRGSLDLHSCGQTDPKDPIGQGASKNTVHTVQPCSAPDEQQRAVSVGMYLA